LRKLVQSALEEIVLSPKSGIPTLFEGVGFIVIKDYLLFYQESEGDIILLSFGGGKQDPEKIKKRLLQKKP